MDTVNLADALNLLRVDLAAAQDAGEGHQFRFEIAEAEIEFPDDAQYSGQCGGQGRTVSAVATLSS